MESPSMVCPLFAMVALTFGVSLYSFFVRVRDVRLRRMDVRYFKTFTVGVPTEAVQKAQRNYANLFEIPVMFYAAAILAIVLHKDSFPTVMTAWAFVVLRALHSIIHLGSNRLYPRMIVFFMGYFCLLALWLQLL